MFWRFVTFMVDGNSSPVTFADLLVSALLCKFSIHTEEKLSNPPQKASILRMISMIVSVEHEDDATWYFSPVIAWTCAEISAAIIVLSLPAFRAVFGFLKEHRLKRDQSYSNGSGSIGLNSVSRKKPRIFPGSTA
jgi:hypothetical protein